MRRVSKKKGKSKEKLGMRASVMARRPATWTFSGIVVAVLLQGVVVLCKAPATLKLERAFPHNQRMELSKLRDRDNLRHSRFLKQQLSSSTKDVPQFRVFIENAIFFPRFHWKDEQLRVGGKWVGLG
uniref:Uncharacterized protein n=1 Tax=Lactuca sativa TaxID=4236 RepID=A0A9R1V728_LACSA|nr:hypothetical protein LSAT_V11C600314980 [Lactuca sativa]